MYLGSMGSKKKLLTKVYVVKVEGNYSAITPLCSTPSPAGLFFLAFILYCSASLFLFNNYNLAAFLFA